MPHENERLQGLCMAVQDNEEWNNRTVIARGILVG